MESVALFWEAPPFHAEKVYWLWEGLASRAERVALRWVDFAYGTKKVAWIWEGEKFHSKTQGSQRRTLNNFTQRTQGSQ